MTDMSNRHPNEVRDIYGAELAKKDELIQRLVNALDVAEYWTPDQHRDGRAVSAAISEAIQLGYLPSEA